jgi:hypothetical protein
LIFLIVETRGVLLGVPAAVMDDPFFLSPSDFTGEALFLMAFLHSPQSQSSAGTALSGGLRQNVWYPRSQRSQKSK